MNQHWFRQARWVAFASLLALFGVHDRAGAQEGQGKFVTEAAVRLVKLVGTANKQGYLLPDNSFSIGGGWLKQNPKDYVVLLTVSLEEGKKYRFIAAGDEDAKDVDLEVHDANGKVVARDDKTDPVAVVDFTPAASGAYTVRIRLFDSVNSLPCVCLGVMLTKKE